jgi:hypothetical protein
LTWDVAATANNTVVAPAPGAESATGRFFSADGLSAFDADWRGFDRRDLLFLNPPFGTIASEWAPLVARWTRALPWLRLLMLTPASVGSEWFQSFVHRRALVLALSPRLQFVGADDPYPKDCMLSVFGYGVAGFDVWRWDEALEPAPAPVKARAPAKRLVRAPAKSLPPAETPAPAPA